MPRLRGLYVLDQHTMDLVYGHGEQRAIDQHVEMIAPPQTRESIARHPSLLRHVDVIFTGWTPPNFDDMFFDSAPELKAIFYAGGAMGLPDGARRRGIALTTAHMANSQPVAEYSLAAILFSLKHGWRLTRETRQQRRFAERDKVPGCYHSTVGLISLGMIARTLLRLLKPLEINVIAYDPFVSAAEAAELGIEKVSLEDLFRRSDVVSLHTPLLDETRDMITGEHLASMKHGATFINTARGEIVRENELIQTAVARPDLHFVLDVTGPMEPPEPDSPLYELSNVVLTPHIAGSAGGECRRLGQYMVEELERFIAGEPLRWAVTPEPMKDGRSQPEVSVKVARHLVSGMATANGNQKRAL